MADMEVEDSSELKFLCFDLETTGLPEQKDRFEKKYNNARLKPFAWWKANLDANPEFFPHAIQMAFCITRSARANCDILEEYESLIAYAGESSPGALAVHGITRERCLERGIPVQLILELLEQKLAGCTHLMGYNIKGFDIPVLLAECVRLGNHNLFRKLQSFQIVEVMHIARDCVGERDPDKGYLRAPKLVNLYKKLFDGKEFGAHDALEDVRATVRCYKRLCEIHPHILSVLHVPDMTDEQRAIHDNFIRNPLEYVHTLICAAPGSGKTFLMMNVMKTLITNYDVKPTRIVLVTYNRDLAEAYEADFRKYGILKSGVSFGHRGTLDSLSYKMLGKHRTQSGPANYCAEWAEYWKGCGRELSQQFCRENYAVRKLRNCQYIFVDEYQDMNQEQLDVLQSVQKIAPAARWFATGDVRQTLYLSRGAAPLTFRTRLPWKFQDLKTTQRCSEPVVQLINKAFQKCEFPTDYYSLRPVFRETILPRSVEATAKDRVVYRYCPESDGQNEKMLRMVRNHLVDIRTRYPHDTIGILSPSIHNDSSSVLLKSIHCLCTETFGYDQIYMLSSDSTSGRGRDKVPSHAIHIRSVHTSKGLTYDHVVLLMCFENIVEKIHWPFRASRMDSMITFFVGASRARHSLLLVDNRSPGDHRTLDCLYDAFPYFDSTSCQLPQQVPLVQVDSTRLMSVTDMVRQHEYSGNSQVLQRCQLDKATSFVEVLHQERPVASHPFWRLTGALQSQRTQSSFWMLYGSFLENVAAMFAGQTLFLPVWIDKYELGILKSAVRSAAMPEQAQLLALVDRYKRVNPTDDSTIPVILKKIFSTHKLVSTDALKIFNNNLRAIQESLARIRNPAAHGRDQLIPDVWRVTRYMNDPDKYVSPQFVFDESTLRPELSTDNFWDYFSRTLAVEMNRMREEGFTLHWQKVTPSDDDVILPGPFQDEQPVEVSGRADVVWIKYGQTHAEILECQVWDMKCHNDELYFTKAPNSSWLQVMYYRHLFQKKMKCRIRVFLWSLLSLRLYELRVDHQ